MELEKIIRDTLTHFIQSHIPAADLSGMDDVFFSYITGVLEELGLPESSEETFDMDTFVEMMEAYIPGFAEIHSGDVCEMMFSLSESLGEARNKGQKAVESGSETPSEDLTKGQEPEAGACNGERLRTPTDGAGAQEGNDLKDGVELLLEMFPACTVSQAEKALAMALGNLEEAVQLIVEEKVEIGPAGVSVKELARPRRTPNHEELKQVILQKYMMVDSADDQKTHRPAPPKEVRAAVPAHQQFVLWLQGLKNQAASPKSNGAGQRQDCSQSLLISKKGILAKVLQGLSVPTIPD
ncbi:PREDICTED: CUE domain-containing protein 2 isoform X2 [Haliaeetus leucocephalus]|uniref:CUE domain-containing protein 2 isoform X2 n=1 Tax=Haliaeetus leucocephalus TaxID=52644 RepID=UPI0005224891|nr:PREDICTED: CUE domain-containing protein 2 isoform X3 [Haliaeetus albicilla]XP_010566017.1 PREDICTED: CUE domain-containing protein 2 isoform X2 [Haliaeetus leucocephalus]